MYINNKFVKIIFKIIISCAVLECLYLFALPPIINHFLSDDFINKFVYENTNADIKYDKLKLKTHIKPDISIHAGKISIKDKFDTYTFLESENLNVKISLSDLLRKRINIKNIKSDSINLYAFSNVDGKFNFEDLFPTKENSDFKLKIKNNSLNLEKYSITFEDKSLKKSLTFQGEPLKVSVKNKELFSLITQGQTLTNDKTSDYDINLALNITNPFKVTPEIVKGKCFLYNIDLSVLEPFVKKFIDKNTKKLSGYIDYIQISSNDDNEKNIVSLNTMFKDVSYDRVNWTNDTHINGKGEINLSVEPSKNLLNVKFLQVKADKIDVKAFGKIDFKEKLPYLDLSAEVNNSRVENIFSMLPQDITKSIGTIEKIKYYGIYGDVEAKGTVKGAIPQPDIEGYVKGRNVHALDKSIHKLHKGTVNINFDKRKLHMDILVELFNNQKATIKGYTYMYRDGVNNIDIKTTNNVDFPLAQKITVPISKIFNFMLGPIVDMNITSGKGIIDVNVQGSIDTIAMHGYTEFRDASLTYNGLYGKLEKGAGRVDFKDDIITVKSKQAYVNSNPASVDGFVKINNKLNFNIKAEETNATDVLEIINKSELLKDVKAGLSLFKEVSKNINLDINIKADIVPVPYGHPPLPPDEAFKNMKVQGNVQLLGNSCFIQGFKIPIEHINGDVDFTETSVDIHPISAISGTSPIVISGTVINDLKTRIPDIDITVKSDSVNLKDTIKFLTESYLYPDNYPDISSLYNIASKHDLYFKYKAKSVDFLTKNAYAEINFIEDDTSNPIKATSGKITMDNAVVTIDDLKADLFDSELIANGTVKNIDSAKPIYDLNISAENFNLENLNDTSKVTIMPENMSDIFKKLKDYKGYADINVSLVKNILRGKVDLKNPEFIIASQNIPCKSDDFSIIFDENKISAKDISADIADMPFFGNFEIRDYYKKPYYDIFFTSKLRQNFINNYVKNEYTNKLTFKGDINLTSKIKGNIDNILIEPDLILYPEADIYYDSNSIGEINDKRELNGKIRLSDKNLYIDELNFIKHISSQNNKLYPMKFMNITGLLKIADNAVIPENINLKTYKNMPARFLNLFFKSQILKQGSFNGEVKFQRDEKNGKSKLTGDVDFINIDIPLYDTVIKHIKLDTDDENINISLFGFLFDERVGLKAQLKNDLSQKPQIKSLNIKADKIDKNKLFEIISKTHTAMNTNNQIKNLDLSGLSINNGHLEIKQFTIKDFEADNFNANFAINENGVFTADNIIADIEQGKILGTISYDLNNTEIIGDFELKDIDSNYLAETLFDAKNQVYGNANGRLYIKTNGINDEERINNLSGFLFADIQDGRMPKLGSLEYLLRAGNIIKSGITGFTLNNVLELLNLVKTGYFSNINGTCIIENGIAKDIEIFSTGENLSLYIHGDYDISKTNAELEILGKLSKQISTIFGALGNTSLNTFFKLIPGISLFDFGRKDFIEDVEKIPSFTNGDYDARIFQAIIDGNINDNNYVQSFKWVK